MRSRDVVEVGPNLQYPITLSEEATSIDTVDHWLRQDEFNLCDAEEEWVHQAEDVEGHLFWQRTSQHHTARVLLDELEVWRRGQKRHHRNPYRELDQGISRGR